MRLSHSLIPTLKENPADAQIKPDGLCPACGTRPGPVELEMRPGPGHDPSIRGDEGTRALRTPHRLLTPLP